ncbi:MAG: DNA replication and repair protein RecF [Actinobacteria bacterium]|nr:MAG: DNA replication and repair protein RecF [Actinomycetota bacterium]
MAHESSHRRPVPELQPAPPGELRGGGDDAASAAPRGRSPRVRHGAAQLSAPAPVRRGRALGLSADPGRRGGARVARDRVRRRADRDRLQPGLPARRARGGCGGHRAAAPDQSTQARADRGARRELLVPHHADPARGLSAGDAAAGGLAVRELTLRDFRSYAGLELELEPGVVLVSGPNGAGKTNLLEALHVGTQGFSPRARTDAQMVRFGTESGRVRVSGKRASTPFSADVVLNAASSRRATLNGSWLQAPEQLRHELQTLVFTPDRLAVVKGGPATRRAYVDRSLGRIFPSRAQLPAEYAAVIGQRNAALRRVQASLSSRDAVAPWTEGAARLGTALAEARREAVELLARAFAECSERLGLFEATLAYDGEPATSEDLEQRLELDLERGTTGLGPHLHDLRLEAGGRELRSYGSQGEQRIAVLALVLAEARTLAERTGATPLVLLDDVLSELDEERRLGLSELFAAGGQTVVTTTSATALPSSPAQSLLVRPGEVRVA